MDEQKFLEDYENEIRIAMKSGFSYNQSIDIAKNAMYSKNEYEITPERLVEDHRLRGKMGNICRIVRKEIENIDDDIDITENPDTESFMDTMRRAAENKIIPYGKYLEPFINGQSNHISTYISLLRKEGWDIKKEKYVYICNRTNKKIIEQYQEEYKQLSEQFMQAGLDGNVSRAFQLVNKMEEVKKQIAKLNG